MLLLHNTPSIRRIAPQKIISINIIDIVFFGIYCKSMIDSKYFCLPKLILLILLFLEFLKFKMSTEPFNNDNFITVIHYFIVYNWFKSTML